jgi:hypothetical protein
MPMLCSVVGRQAYNLNSRYVSSGIASFSKVILGTRPAVNWRSGRAQPWSSRSPRRSVPRGGVTNVAAELEVEGSLSSSYMGQRASGVEGGCWGHKTAAAAV